jgi:uncharacterized membrane protein
MKTGKVLLTDRNEFWRKGHIVSRTFIIFSMIFLFIILDNLTDEVIGDPILDVVLEPGDLLYFPRGTIHQVWW